MKDPEWRVLLALLNRYRIRLVSLNLLMLETRGTLGLIREDSLHLCLAFLILLAVTASLDAWGIEDSI